MTMNIIKPVWYLGGGENSLTEIPVVIPTYNAVEHLRRCILALQKYTVVPHHPYIADDYSPSQELHSYLNELEETGQAVILKSKVRRGFAGINNWAVNQLPSSDSICLLNSDTEPKQGWLGYMLEELKTDPQVGLVGALLVYPRNKGGRWAGTIQHAGVARTSLVYPHHPFRGKNPSYALANRRRELNAVTAACILIRREAWDQLRGFNEEFSGGQFEDVDFCWRAREAGWKIIYQPKAVLIHFEHGSGVEWVSKTSARNCERLRERWKGLEGDEHLFR